MILIYLSISVTKNGLKVKERPWEIVKHNPKTIEISRREQTQRIKKSKIGTNNSVMRQDLIGKFHFETWVLPANVEATKEKVIAGIIEEAKERVKANSAVIDAARTFFKSTTP